MVTQNNSESDPDLRPALRNEPMQARSTARLTALLDAAAAVVHQIGFERLTTAMVADGAGSSIGTVYRYFPDRIALLQALGARNLERVLTKVEEQLADQRHGDALAAVNAVFGVFVDAYRDEPGFRSLRVGDVIDLHPAPTERSYKSILSDRIVEALSVRFGLANTAELRFAFETAIEVADALVTRAFARNPRGDEAFLAAGRDAVHLVLAKHIG